MFTGIITAVGSISGVAETGGDRRLHIDADGLDMAGIKAGDSICVNGVCLTATDLDRHGFAADVSAETLSCTTLGGLAAGAKVNLEPSLRAGDRLGGHLVSGHTDGVGTVLALERDARSLRCRIRVPSGLARYICRKGSVCVDGVSLTVNEAGDTEFGVNIIPHTLSATIIGGYTEGTSVNLEVDMIARYLERLSLGET